MTTPSYFAAEIVILLDDFWKVDQQFSPDVTEPDAKVIEAFAREVCRQMGQCGKTRNFPLSLLPPRRAD